MIIHWFMGIYTIINKSNVEIYVEIASDFCILFSTMGFDILLFILQILKLFVLLLSEFCSLA